MTCTLLVLQWQICLTLRWLRRAVLMMAMLFLQPWCNFQGWGKTWIQVVADFPIWGMIWWSNTLYNGRNRSLQCSGKEVSSFGVPLSTFIKKEWEVWIGQAGVNLRHPSSFSMERRHYWQATSFAEVKLEMLPLISKFVKDHRPMLNIMPLSWGWRRGSPDMSLSGMSLCTCVLISTLRGTLNMSSTKEGFGRRPALLTSRPNIATLLLWCVMRHLTPGSTLQTLLMMVNVVLLDRLQWLLAHKTQRLLQNNQKKNLQIWGRRILMMSMISTSSPILLARKVESKDTTQYFGGIPTMLKTWNSLQCFFAVKSLHKRLQGCLDWQSKTNGYSWYCMKTTGWTISLCKGASEDLRMRNFG